MATSNPDTCPDCLTQTPPGSQFCPQCGTCLSKGETLELNPDPTIVPDAKLVPGAALAESPSAIQQVYRRPLGINPVPLLAGLAALALLLAIILLATGSLVSGLILLGAAIALLTLFFAGARQEADAPGAPFVLRAAHQLKSLAGLAALTVRAWARAAADLTRIHRRRQQLRGELKASLAPLGEAVHHDDQPRADALKQQAAEIEQKLGETEREASAILAATRQAIESERATIEPTQALNTTPTQEVHDETIATAGPPSNGQAHTGGAQRGSPSPATTNGHARRHAASRGRPPNT
jgi:hypothetical protein